MATVYSKKNGVSLPADVGSFDGKSHTMSAHTFIPDDDGEGSFHDGKFERHHGLHWFVTGVFVIGELAGGGLVALPTAITHSGFTLGIVTLAVMTCIFTYTAYILGQCWIILQRRWPEYRSHCRKPYAEISYRAVGKKFKTLVSICINITQFGITVVFLCLASKNISDFIKTFFGVNVSLCWVIIALAIAIFPVMLLKSPEEFWWAGIVAMCTTSCAVVLICIGSIRDYETCKESKKFPEFKITNYFGALGAILFAYGGHPVFPTIQHDMRKPHHFTRSAIQAYIVLTFMYFPASILGSLTYGDSLQDSVINSIQTQWIQSAVNIFITLHIIFTLVIMSNPLNQEVEEMFGIPQDFGIKRIISRGFVLLAAVFLAETIPSFGPLLDLVGASTMTLTSCFFPALFYLFLRAKEEKADEKSTNPYKKSDIDETPSFHDIVKYNSNLTIALCAIVLVFGVVGGAGATYSSIKELTGTNFQVPCYLKPWLEHAAENVTASHTNCCGQYQNIKRSPDITCNAPRDFFNQGKFGAQH